MGKKKRGGKAGPQKDGDGDKKDESPHTRKEPEQKGTFPDVPVGSSAASATAMESPKTESAAQPVGMARYEREQKAQHLRQGGGVVEPVGAQRGVGRGRGRGQMKPSGSGPAAGSPAIGRGIATSGISSTARDLQAVQTALEHFPPLSSPEKQPMPGPWSKPVQQKPAQPPLQLPAQPPLQLPAQPPLQLPAKPPLQLPTQPPLQQQPQRMEPGDFRSAEMDRPVVEISKPESPSSPMKTPEIPAFASPRKVGNGKTRMELQIGGGASYGMPGSGKVYKPIPRPNYGKKGSKIILRANFFQMKIRPDVVIYHYDIDIKPEIKSKEKMRMIIKMFVKTNERLFKGIFPVYDGRKSMYTNGPLSLSSKQDKFNVFLEGERPNAKPFTVAIQYAAVISLSTLMDFFNKRAEYPQEAVQSMDVVLRELPNHKFVPLRQYFYTNPTRDGNLTDAVGLELWSGFYQSVRPGWKCMMLQVDSSVRVFHKGQRVIDLCAEFFQCRVEELNDRPMHEKERQDFADHVRGLQVEIDTDRYKMLTRRSYKLIGLSPNISKDQTFPMAQPNGTEVPTKVADYFKKQYDINLEFPVLHCLQAQPAEKHRYLPMEICVVKKGQQLKKLTDALTSQLIRYSAIPATQREAEINKLVSSIGFHEDPFAKAYGMSINDKMIEFEGRVLDAPQIEYSNRKIPVREGSWNMQRVQFYSSAEVKEMAVLNFDSRTTRQTLENFVSELIKNAREVGMSLPQPFISLTGKNVEDVRRLMLQIRKPNLGLILVVMPSQKSNDIYGEIKKVGDIELGVATQCVLSKNVYLAKVQTIVNICLKINAKLGKVNSIPDSNQKTPMMSIPVMIMGADVTHPAPGDTSNPSIAAVTGSYDSKACCYTARISMQKHRQEIIADLESITKDLLNNFIKKLNRKPQRIIFYRDGVSEGQFREVLSTELQAIQKACYLIEEGYQPAITFITVQKRHHARLFAKDSRQQVGRSKNVPAGTTVDTTIVHPIEFDFYLCSHQGIQGTSRPAHYYVLYDDSNFHADDIQELTYRLCHVYARCTRSVSIPAPVYYAHHCAFRGRYYLDRMGKQGKLPDNERLMKNVLDDMNSKCLINDNYQGMFFA